MVNILCSGEQFIAPITGAECINCAQRYLDSGNYPPCGYTLPLVRAIINSQQNRFDSIHVTDLTGCLRRSYFSKRDQQPIHLHALLIAMLGIAIHDYIEKQNPEFSEKRVESEGLVGSVDFMTEHGIVDYKTTRWMSPERLPYGSHEEQVNIYRLLAKNNGKLAIQYIDMTGPTRCRKCKKLLEIINGVPQCPECGYTSANSHIGATVKEVEVKDTNEIQQTVQQRYAILKNALDTNIPPAPEAGWLCSYCSVTPEQCDYKE